ncbi:hypothetical protein DY000_02031903 [Brassica cretica]|uniref:Uncharacterized protein n=1 Tax=Brassica cretica TaxID=69181 RepID=A0ABQ7DUZ9_BRACR|nr:hypothetical protein DY000_02031903 [Brassica cretica]
MEEETAVLALFIQVARQTQNPLDFWGRGNTKVGFKLSWSQLLSLYFDGDFDATTVIFDATTPISRLIEDFSAKSNIDEGKDEFQCENHSRRLPILSLSTAIQSKPGEKSAAKAKRNNGQGKSIAEYSTIWEMKKEDLMMKEKLSKLVILDTLLAKKDPLTEAEEVVKNKLLAEYF